MIEPPKFGIRKSHELGRTIVEDLPWRFEFSAHRIRQEAENIPSAQTLRLTVADTPLKRADDVIEALEANCMRLR